MSKTFFVDSENVGDYWVSLLAAIAPEDRVLVFYTSKSPHMSYRNLIALKESDRDVTFIECYEGANALDFQLCSELGYRIHDIADGEFIIVSNDMGFDAAVRYWRHRNMAVQRIPGKACVIMKNAVKTETPTESARVVIPAEPVQEIPAEAEDAGTPSATENLKFDGTMPEEALEETAEATPEEPAEKATEKTPEAADVTPVEATSPVTEEPVVAEEAAPQAPQPEEPAEEATEEAAEAPAQEAPAEPTVILPTIEEVMAEITAPQPVTIDDTAKEVLYLIGKKNLQDLHEALIQLYGAESGMAIYNVLKSGNDYNRFLAEHPQLTLTEKQDRYCRIVFSMEEPAVEMPENLPQVLMTSWEKKKNLYTLRGALQTEYGKAKGEKYYSIMKAHAKMLGRIK